MAQYKSTLEPILLRVQEDLEAVKKRLLINLAEDLVESSKQTVDTGAYITSHTVSANLGSARSNVSDNLPKSQDPNAKAQESLAQMLQDINSLPEGLEIVYISNASPHALLVEYKHGYNVYNSVRNRAGQHIKDAVSTVRGRQ